MGAISPRVLAITLLFCAAAASCNRPVEKQEPGEGRFRLCSVAATGYAKEAVHPTKPRWRCGFLDECLRQTEVRLQPFERGTIEEMLEQRDCFTKRSESYAGGCDWF